MPVDWTKHMILAIIAVTVTIWQVSKLRPSESLSGPVGKGGLDIHGSSSGFEYDETATDWSMIKSLLQHKIDKYYQQSLEVIDSRTSYGNGRRLLMLVSRPGQAQNCLYKKEPNICETITTIDKKDSTTIYSYPPLIFFTAHESIVSTGLEIPPPKPMFQRKPRTVQQQETQSVSEASNANKDTTVTGSDTSNITETVGKETTNASSATESLYSAQNKRIVTDDESNDIIINGDSNEADDEDNQAEKDIEATKDNDDNDDGEAKEEEVVDDEDRNDEQESVPEALSTDTIVETKPSSSSVSPKPLSRHPLNQAHRYPTRNEQLNPKRKTSSSNDNIYMQRTAAAKRGIFGMIAHSLGLDGGSSSNRGSTMGGSSLDRPSKHQFTNNMNTPQRGKAGRAFGAPQRGPGLVARQSKYFVPTITLRIHQHILNVTCTLGYDTDKPLPLCSSIDTIYHQRNPYLFTPIVHTEGENTRITTSSKLNDLSTVGNHNHHSGIWTDALYSFFMDIQKLKLATIVDPDGKPYLFTVPVHHQPKHNSIPVVTTPITPTAVSSLDPEEGVEAKEVEQNTETVNKKDTDETHPRGTTKQKQQEDEEL